MADKIIYVVDLDGTLYDNRHRQHLIPEDRANAEEWVAFNGACKDDIVREPVRRLVQTLIDAGQDVRFFTGRGFSAFKPTSDCLYRDFNGADVKLAMRRMNDHRPAAQVKCEYLDVLMRSEYAAGIMAIEDDESCVAAMRAIPGVTVLQIDSLCAAVLEKGDANK